MAPSVKSVRASKRAHQAAANGGEASVLLDLLLARAPAEDTAAYDKDDLARAASLAGQALAAHRKGESVVAVDRMRLAHIYNAG